jgi:sugar lactone lactonase YvrE
MKTIPKVIYAFFAAVTLPVGAVTANGAVNDLFVSVNGSGSNGGGFIYHYTSTGVRSIFSSGLSRPRGVAFDQFTNLFVATNTFHPNTGTVSAAILKILPDGTQTTFANINGPSADFFASGVTFDSAGNLFVMVLDDTDPNAASTIYKFAPNGTQSTFGAVPGQGFGLAFDGAGNLYAADAVDRIIYKFTTDGTRTVFASMTNAGPVGLAFDQAGNLFVSTEVNPGSDTIFKFTPDGTQSTFAMGLNTPRGLAFNRGGILFVAEIIQTGPGDILRFTPSGSGNVFASGIGPGGNGGPEYLAVQLPTKPH